MSSQQEQSDLDNFFTNEDPSTTQGTDYDLLDEKIKLKKLSSYVRLPVCHLYSRLVRIVNMKLVSLNVDVTVHSQ